MKNITPGSKAGGQESASGPVKTTWKTPDKIDDALDVSAPKPTLTSAQQQELARLVAVIESGWTTVLEVGRALAEIRDKGLYKDKYAIFEEYCRKEWGFSKTHVNRQIAASHVVDVLTPIGVTVKNEAVARPMTGLTEAQIRQTYKDAEKLAEKQGKPITAAIVKKAAVKFRPAEPRTGGKRGAKKASVAKSINLKPALNLLAKVEKVAEENKDQLILKELKALRKCLEKLAEG
jgi:hypothetical protein